MNNKIFPLRLLTLGSIIAVAGCVSVPYQPYAREVKRKSQQGGVIALKQEHRDEDRTKAQELMNRVCSPLKVKILEEGEVVVGQETNTKANTSYKKGSDGQKVGSLFGLPLVSGQSDPSQNSESSASVTQLKEWQIVYECEHNNKKNTAN